MALKRLRERIKRERHVPLSFLRAGGELSDGMDIGYVDSLAIHPPFSFRLAEKKTGRGRSKRKDSGRKLARACKFA